MMNRNYTEQDVMAMPREARRRIAKINHIKTIPGSNKPISNPKRHAKKYSTKAFWEK